MSNIRLTLGCGDYDLTRALIDGTVRPPGIDLTVLPMSSPERHWRMMRFEEFDVAELSMSHYLVAHSEGRGFRAIPVFPHRRFRHSFVFCRTSAEIEEPGYLDVRGALIGAGAALVPVEVDEQGIKVAEGVRKAAGARLAVVSPSHQYPTGATLSQTYPRTSLVVRSSGGSTAPGGGPLPMSRSSTGVADAVSRTLTW